MTEARRRILFVSSAATLFGGEVTLLHVLRRFDRARWDFHFLVPAEGDYARAIRDRGWSVTVFDVSEGLGGGRRSELGTAYRLSRLIRSLGPDLVHLNLHFPFPIVSAGCAMARAPLVMHVRNMVAPRPVSRWNRYLFGRSVKVICISESVRSALLASGLVAGSKAARITVIPDARDLDALAGGDREHFRAELGISESSPLIGMVARFDRSKGQDIFLEAARIVATRVPAARFVLVGGLLREGDRPYQAELERIAADPVLRGRVTILGYRGDVPDILAALDCFVHSSRRGAFVSVLIEAMAAGVPVVASDVDGIPECVGRDGAGVLVSPIEPATFADRITEIITDPDRSLGLALAGRLRVRTCFDAAPLARDTEAVFLEPIA